MFSFILHCKLDQNIKNFFIISQVSLPFVHIFLFLLIYKVREVWDKCPRLPPSSRLYRRSGFSLTLWSYWNEPTIPGAVGGRDAPLTVKDPNPSTLWGIYKIVEWSIWPFPNDFGTHLIDHRRDGYRIIAWINDRSILEGEEHCCVLSQRRHKTLAAGFTPVHRILTWGFTSLGERRSTRA